MQAFKLAINMPGAVSAGAYTAGVLDFLIEALDAWEEAKAAGEAVPAHRVSLEALTGASAGGMCAAIAAVQLKENFPHIRQAAGEGEATGNRLYDSWVQRINILRLLETRDLAKDPAPVSVLDCTVLDEIAETALTIPARQIERAYLSPTLTLILTLTNLRGTYYPLYANRSKSAAERACYFGDRLRFQYGAAQRAADGAAVEPLPEGGGGSWEKLKTAALATGAFPVALAPRLLRRRASEYQESCWSEAGSQATIPPDFNGQVEADGTITTLNADGGITDNNPFALAHDLLRHLEPQPEDGRNARTADRADRAVLTIAPFPARESFSEKFSRPTSVPAVAARVLDVLVAQSRFQSESFGLLMSADGFSRFAIAPRDEERAEKDALQSGVLGAFGGFFSKGFRDHDFQLGRRNCQRFLSNYLVFRSDNPVLAPGLAGLTAEQLDGLSAPAPATEEVLPAEVRWIPLIPLCGAARADVPYPARFTMQSGEFAAIGAAIHGRVRALVHALIEQSAHGLKAHMMKLLADLALLTVRGKKIAAHLARAMEETSRP